METTKTRYQRRHIFTAGRRCKSPCLRQQDLCYFHQTTRPATAPPANTHPEYIPKAQESDPETQVEEITHDPTLGTRPRLNSQPPPPRNSSAPTSPTRP
jgi:hypothetical protein